MGIAENSRYLGTFTSNSFRLLKFGNHPESPFFSEDD